MKKNILYIAILLVLFVILVLIEYLKPKPIDWTESYRKEDKIPFGTYVLFNLMPDMFPGNTIETSDVSVFEMFNQKDTYNKNLIFICEDFSINEPGVERLLAHVSEGNHAFIAANYIGGGLADTLNLEIGYDFIRSVLDSLHIGLNFVNPELKTTKGYYYPNALRNNYIASVDTANATLLGKQNNQKANFVKINYGDGAFLINSQPLAFTNYNIIKADNAEYAFKALSYLPPRDFIWDSYIGKAQIKPHTQMRYILSQDALKSAYFTLIITLLLYILFEVKRKQRLIPEIKPHRNTSLEFVRTIGRLYYHNKNHKDLAEKKFNYLQEFLRHKYYIRQADIDNKDFKKIAQRTGARLLTVERIFLSYRKITSKLYVEEKDLFNFNRVIEEFYQDCV